VTCSESRESVHLAPMFRCPVATTTAAAAAAETVSAVNQPTGVLEKGRDENDPDLAKFIPIRLPVPSLMPIISHNRIDRSEWFRAQLALDAARSYADESRTNVGPSRSRSDSSLHKTTETESNGNGCDGNECDNGRDVINWRAVLPEVEGVYQPSRYARSSHSSDGKATAISERTPLAAAGFADVNDSRFDETTNSEFCRVNVGVTVCCPTDDGVVETTSSSESRQVQGADVWAELYVELPRGRQINVTLYHVKVDLACTALRTYLDPCCQVS